MRRENLGNSWAYIDMCNMQDSPIRGGRLSKRNGKKQVKEGEDLKVRMRSWN